METISKMRSALKHILLLIIPMVMIGVFITSCSEDELPNNGEPVIYYVRDTDPEKSDSLYGGAFLGNLIAIIGDNLGDTREIWFNDKEAVVTTTYVTNKSILVSVPSESPGVVTNKLVLVFNSGKRLEYEFNVSVPEPVVNSMKNEWPIAGETAVVRGNYFFEPLTLTLADGTVIEPSSITQTELQFEVPSNIASGPITVTTNFGTATSLFHVRDNRNIFASMDTVPHNWWHGGNMINMDPAIPAIANNYLLVKHDVSGPDDWFEFFVGPADNDIRLGTKNIPADAILHPENYDLKMEINSQTPFVAGSQVKLYIGNNMAGERGDQYYAWMPNFDTKKEWETITIPFLDVMAPINNVDVNPEGYGISFWFHGGAAMPAYFALDNMRVVPNK